MRIGVFGGGAWGTALASLWAATGHAVILWARDPQTVAAINEHHENPARLKGINLDNGLAATADPARAADCDAAVIVVPAQALRRATDMLAKHLPAGIPVVLCAKGIERETGLLMSDVAGATLPGHPIVALSGPSFAADVARGLPTAVTLAAADAALAADLARRLSAPHVRLYASGDLVGVEIGGAAKNVLAIACGISDGLGFGASAKAALIARGFAELRRFALARGADPETLAGLSGLGDLVLTCSGPQSRNMAFGMRLGGGMGVAKALAAGGGICEGAATAPVLVRLAENAGIAMPIAAAVDAVIAGRTDVRGAVESLLSRPLPTREN
jgi:glycerol-3-phosphate dehydrogenase (NAD(P)+)